ncbi:MAG TPA: BNR-4 repeat-containing protein [Bacteroidales bacterium]|nr:BNR-4 repeat-containing protein [Bacteroidales bacterium]
MNYRKILYSTLLILLIAQVNAGAQNKRADGYMGIWFRFGEPGEFGYKFSGGLATFSSQHTSMAVYAPEVQKTFFVYCGTAAPDTSHIQIMISYFDHLTHRVPRPVIVLDKMGVKDPQDNASISIDRNGFIWVFISGRGRTRPGYIFRSNFPWSIDSFKMTYSGEILFPQTWRMNDSSIVMMYTKASKGLELYWTKRAGTSWTDPRKLAGFGGHFQVTNVNGNRLFSVFNVCPDGNPDTRTNLYLIYTDDSGQTWKNIDDKEIQTPVCDIKNAALIHDFMSEKKLVYIQDLNFDDNGNPVILILVSRDFKPGPSGEPREWVVVSRRNGSWNFSKICNMPHNYSLGSIYTTGDQWKVIGPSDPGPDKYGTGGELVLWTSNDNGQTWNKSVNITSGSSMNQSYARRPLNASGEFFSFWSDGDTKKFSRSHLYFTNDKGDKVWILPYKMSREYEKPERIK